MPADSAPGAGRWWPKALLAVGAVLLTLAGIEGLLRWTWTTEKVTLVYDPLLGFRGRGEARTIWTREMFGRPRVVELNAGGFHDHERTPRPPPGTQRLVFLGDSYLEAYQVGIDSGFAQRLARRLTAADPAAPVEAVNLGVHGYGLGVYVLQVQQRLRTWHADAVVLCLFLGNDLHDNFAPIASPAVPRFSLRDGVLEVLPPPARDLRIWLRDEVLARSSLGRWLWLRVIKTSGTAMAVARAAGMVSTPDLVRSATGQLEQMLGVGEALLRQLVAEVRRQQLPLHVFVVPDPFLVHDLARARRGAAPVAAADQRLQTEAAVLQWLRVLGVPFTYPRTAFVDADIAGASVYRHGFGHFTDAAHAQVAELLEVPLRHLLSAAEPASGLIDSLSPAR